MKGVLRGIGRGIAGVCTEVLRCFTVGRVVTHVIQKSLSMIQNPDFFINFNTKSRTRNGFFTWYSLLTLNCLRVGFRLL